MIKVTMIIFTLLTGASLLIASCIWFIKEPLFQFMNYTFQYPTPIGLVMFMTPVFLVISGALGFLFSRGINNGRK